MCTNWSALIREYSTNVGHTRRGPENFVKEFLELIYYGTFSFKYVLRCEVVLLFVEL